MLIVESLSKQLSDAPLFEELSFSVNRKERLAIVGPSGAGKTTLLKCLAGLIPVDNGKIVWQDQVLTDKDRIVSPWNRNMSMVFQDLALWPHLTVSQHLQQVLSWSKIDKSHRNEKEHKILERLELDNFVKRYPHELSGGQQQRLAFARMLATEPEIALLDEAFNQQDSTLNKKMWTILLEQQELNGLTIIFTSHEKSQLENYATSCLELAKFS